MSKSLVKSTSQLPAAILNALGGQLPTDDLSGGVSAGFPILSFRGKVWRYRESGNIEIFEDEHGDPLPSIEVILVSANPRLSKIFYQKKYEEGDQEAPDCFSIDGVRPDPQSTKPQSKTCAGCPHNVWGSKVTEAGKKTKACQDARRMAVVFPFKLEEEGEDAKPALLRVPAASLADLKVYGEKLGSKGLPYFSVVTRLSFDREASYPKLVMRPLRVITEEEATLIMAMRDAEITQQIISTAVEHISDAEPEVEEEEEELETVTAPAKSAKPAKQQTLFDDDEDDDEEEEEEEAKPAKKVAAKKKAPAKKAPAKKAAAKEPEAAPPPADEDLESELDALLNDL